jgi:hypothetical protein
MKKGGGGQRGQQIQLDTAESEEDNGRCPKSCSNQVVNFKLGCFLGQRENMASLK